MILVAVSWKDYIKKIGDIAAPAVEVKIDGKKWSSDEVIISSAEVLSSVGCEASTCSIEFKLMRTFIKKDDIRKKNVIKIHSDFSDIKVGSKLEVSFGHQLSKKADLKSVFIGYISAFDLSIDNKSITTLVIQGMDAKMWMMTSKKTELKKNLHKYSMVVKNVCNAYSGKLKGSFINIKDEVEFESDIYQQNESDYEFLCRIANYTGCMFFISQGKLYFVSISALKSTGLKISPDRKIYNIKLSASIWGIPKSVEVVSINKKDYEKLVEAKAVNSDVIGKGKTAASLTTNINDENTVRIIDNTVRSVKEAKFLSQALYNKRELNLLELNVEIYGYPDAELGTGVTIEDFGDPIDNNYIITQIRHCCYPERFVTYLKLHTNRVNPQKNGVGF